RVGLIQVDGDPAPGDVTEQAVLRRLASDSEHDVVRVRWTLGRYAVARADGGLIAYRDRDQGSLVDGTCTVRRAVDEASRHRDRRRHSLLIALRDPHDVDGFARRSRCY